MATSATVQAWTLRMPAGSAQNWTFTFTTPAPGGTDPYSISGADWEYVARTSATDTSPSPLVKITTSPSAAGLITVTSTAALSQILLQIYPAATAALAGTYWHALWYNPATTTETAVFGGTESLLLVEGTPAP